MPNQKLIPPTDAAAQPSNLLQLVSDFRHRKEALIRFSI